jgi:hypothetical protein
MAYLVNFIVGIKYHVPGTHEIVSKVILRHADLSTTQRYFGKVNDSEAIR